MAVKTFFNCVSYDDAVDECGTQGSCCLCVTRGSEKKRRSFLCTRALPFFQPTVNWRTSGTAWGQYTFLRPPVAINWLVLINDASCVYFAVRAESINVSPLKALNCCSYYSVCDGEASPSVSVVCGRLKPEVCLDVIARCSFCFARGCWLQYGDWDIDSVWRQSLVAKGVPQSPLAAVERLLPAIWERSDGK
jgi:hypothetical protein